LNFKIWMDVLEQPIQTFKKAKKNADLMQGLMYVAVAGVIIGILSGIKIAVYGNAMTSLLPSLPGAFGVVAFIATVIATPIANVLSWLFVSAIMYVMARLLEGKGNFKTQSYLYAIYVAPIGIISAVLGLIPVIGGILSIIPAIYGLYLLTMSLKETHGYSTGRAILTWILPALVLALIAAIIGAAIATLFLAGLSMPAY
jgi:hypothetical protein